MTDFIETYYVSEELADKINKVYDDNKDKYVVEGKVGVGIVNKEIKDSKDLPVSPHCYDEPFDEYRKKLQEFLELYIEKYTRINKLAKFNIKQTYNIQRYDVGGGFKDWHCERNGTFDSSVKRCLVFMTYLNDVEDGGTEFLYYNKTIKAEKGKTIIWPSDWTHTHRGQISNTKEKTIVTGWYSYCWDEENS